MASNLRVDSIVPATGSSVSIGTATGGVSIPGVLTYEDVTNVDSVGVITARGGIRIGATGANTLISGTATGIGIGEDSPDSLLHIGKGTNADDGAVALTIGGSSANTRQSTITKNNVGSGDRALEIRAATGGSDETIKFLSDATTERLRIGSAGQIGIAGANYGTSGQVLTSQGNSSAVQWATPVIYTEYSTQTVSGANSYSITITGDPKVFEVSLFEVRHANAQNIMYRLSNSGGETTSGYYDVSYYHQAGGNGNASRGYNQGQGCLVNYDFNGADNLITGKAIFTKVNTGLYSFSGIYNMRFHADNGGNDQYVIHSSGHINNNQNSGSTVTQFRIFTSSGGNFTSGTINVRGIA